MHSRRGSLAARAASLALASARAPSARGARPAPSARAPLATAASRVLASADAPAANTSARPLARTGLLALTAAAVAACTAAPEATHARRSETTSGATAFDRAEACAKHLETLGVRFPTAEIRPVDPGRSSRVEAHGLGLFVPPRNDAPSPEPAASNPASSESSPVSGGSLTALLRGLLPRALLPPPPPVALCAVPATLAITAASAVAHPTLGATFATLLEDGDIDERLATMLFLIVERRRGKNSPLAPYIDALPRTFKTPLFYDDEELEGLAGTNLRDAAMAQRKALARVLNEHVRPAGKRLFRALRETPRLVVDEEASEPSKKSREKKRTRQKSRRDRFGFGVVGERVAGGDSITAEEFAWAYAAFWSRALAVEVDVEGSKPGGGESASASAAVEAIVPGIDFANHDGRAPNARWALVDDPFAEASSSDTTSTDKVIALLAEPGHVPEPGAEILISYGAKPNEELLFVHGFVDPANAHDALVLRAPGGGGGDDDASDASSSASDAASSASDAASSASSELASSLASETRRARDALIALRGSDPRVTLPATPPRRGLDDLPATTLATLEAWGFSPARLDAELRREWAALEAPTPAAEAARSASEPIPAPPSAAERREAQRAGLLMALAAQRERLEAATTRDAADPEKHAATGSRRAIARAVEAARGRRVDEVVAADPLAPPVARQCAVYRAGVARMTRAYEAEAARWK